MSYEDAALIISGQTKEEYDLMKQKQNLSSIQYALSSFKEIAGFYPNALDLLKLSREDVSKLPNVTKATSNVSIYGSSPILRAIPNDVYTGAPYTYTKKGSDYELVYTMDLGTYKKGSAVRELYTESYPYKKLTMAFVSGKNTMNSKTLSKEALILSGTDSDSDGVPDALEDYIGANKYKKDSDGDGYSDYEEIRTGTNPLGAGKLE